MSIGENIRRQRKSLNFTQQELADNIGVKRAVISKYEIGHISPTIKTVSKIAVAVGVTAAALIEEGENMRLDIPTENEEQQALFQWAHYQRGKYPELDLLYHIPNGGRRGKAEAGRFKAEGVKSGVPDVCLPVARGRYHGLYIEMKRQKGSATTSQQSEWLKNLNKQGYHASICKGWENAAQTIINYLDLEVCGNEGQNESL